MSSQLPNPLQLLEIIHRYIVKLFRERNWSNLLLVIFFLIFLGFGPKIDQSPFLGIVISSINKEPPTWYWAVFWITELVIFSVSVRLELRKQRVDNPQSTSDSQSDFIQIKFFRFFLLTVVLVVAWKLIVVPLGQHVIESYQASNPNQNTVLKCDIRNDKDCFSWGEDILISKVPAFEGEEDWKRKCTDDWAFKKAGTISYEKQRFEDAAIDFKEFVTTGCRNDPEAWIYLNNAKSSEIGGNPLRIAVSVPISRKEGKGAFDAQQVLRGVALAQEQINNSDTPKRKLLVGIVDDGYEIVNDDIETKVNERETAKNIADFISKNRDTVGVVGHSSSDATEAAAEVYNQQKLVAISPTSTAVRKPQDPDGVNLGKYVFRAASNDKIAAEKLARKASMPYRRIAIVYDGDSKYSRSFKKAFKTVFEDEQGRIVNNDKEDRCDISKNAGYKHENGPIECLEQAKKGNAEALLLVPSNANLDDVERVIKLNFKEASPLPLLGSDTMYDKRFLSATAKDMIIIVPWHRHIQPSKFETEAKEVFGYKNEKNEEQEPFKINWETAMAYDATQALAEGLRKASQSCFLHPLFLWDKYAQSTCLRKELKNTLSNTNFKANGVLGVDSVKFNQYGDRAKGNGIGVLVKVCEVENSKVNSQRKEKEFEFRKTNDRLQCIDG